MPYSDNSNIDYVSFLFNKFNYKTILDVGAGAGKYSDIAHENLTDFSIDAIEVWEPYLSKFNLKEKYTNIYLEDVRSVDDFDYDLVILGDILEHMTKEEAQDVWNKVSAQSRQAMISIPIIHYPQGHEEGNPYEEHIKDDWSHDEVLESFPGILHFQVFNTTATYWAKF